MQILALSLALLLANGVPAAGQKDESAPPRQASQPSVAPESSGLRAFVFTEATTLTLMPGHVTLAAGNNIVFTNADPIAHQLVVRKVDENQDAAQRPEPLPLLQPKESFSYRFSSVGTYEVADADYPGQPGHVVVVANENNDTRQSYSFSQTVASDMAGMLDDGVTGTMASGSSAGADRYGSAPTGDARGAAMGPGTTCPVEAPIKTFSILAIDVDITLNRFGYHDPQGKMYVLEENLAAVRAQETARLPDRVQNGLRDDPIQPLVIRANLGDCVNVSFKNQLTASNKPASIDIHRGDVDPSESGSNAGNNSNSIISPGQAISYTWYLENRPEMEGTMYFHSHGDTRTQTSHGLFGALIGEPPGSTYLSPETGSLLKSGWEAMIVPPSGLAFREFALIYHEVGDESYLLKDKHNDNVPLIDPVTGVYRPGTRAINYRTEPHGLRLALTAPGGRAAPGRTGDDESHGYGSYTFGDPATPIPFSYLGDPYKTRLLHGGTEVFHSHHYHGGTVRWPLNPKADPSFAVQLGLNKSPPLHTQSARLDVQLIGPGEAYDLDHECVSGGCQQVAGEFLYHCHFPSHYVGGMWAFYRVFNTLLPNLQELPDRSGKIAAAVNSLGLIGKSLPSGRVLTRDTLDTWIESLLPPQGVPGLYDATVYDWTKTQRPEGSLYFKEPEDTATWENFASTNPGQRPEIKFDPNTGLLEFPFLTPHLAKRPPFAPGAHGPAPYLMSEVPENSLPTNSDFAVQPADPNRPNDALCPAGSPVKRFNLVGIPLPVLLDNFGTVDQGGQIFVLAEDADDILAGRKPAQPLVIRANARDCVYVSYVSRMSDTQEVDFFSKTSLHPHFYQFDTQASDGVITGFSYEQSVRPYPTENRSLTQNLTAGSSAIQVTNATNLRPGIWIGVGLGTNGIEQHRIASISGNTITLVQPLVRAHSAGEAVGVEFVNELWYPDVVLSTVFAHDHVFGDHSWGHGLVSALVVEPPGSTYHDPTTGQEIRSGPIADIHTTNAVAIDEPGRSFREAVIMLTDTSYDGKGNFNLRREPFQGRLLSVSDASLLFSSVTHGDPATPLPRAYQGDPTVFRLLQTGTNEANTFHLTGHENRPERFPGATVNDVTISGIAERFDLVLEGGAGRAGDYMYFNTEKNHFEEGMWGIFRVHDTLRSDLMPLPGRPAPPVGIGFPTLSTGSRPARAPEPGNTCPASAPVKQFDVVAMQASVTLNSKYGITQNNMQIFAAVEDENDIAGGKQRPAPLVLWAAEGDCLQITLTNRLSTRVSLHSGMESSDPQRSQGITIGYNYDQSVAPNQSITYRAYADHETRHGMMMDFANGAAGPDNGLYGAISIGPKGARFYDPITNNETKYGWQAVVTSSDHAFLPRREYVLLFQDQDPVIGKSLMPYPKDAAGHALINYRTEPLARRLAQDPDTSKVFSSTTLGDPDTPILQAFVGDPVTIHVLEGSGYQAHTFFVDGHSYPLDGYISGSLPLGVRSFGPLSPLHAELAGGAGGPRRLAGDYLYGNHRGPFLEAGQWGILRVLNPGSSSLPPLPNSAPVASPDAISVFQNSNSNPINVLANDRDPDSNPLVVAGVGQAAHGVTAVGPGDANVLYTPNTGYLGTDSFTYTSSDGALQNVASVNITITIPGANQAPLAASDSFTVTAGTSNNLLGVLVNDSDPDGQAVKVTTVTQGAGGSVAIASGGAGIIYSPRSEFAGTDSFTYTISDGLLASTGTVSIIAQGTNRPPEIVDDSAGVVGNSSGNTINVLANDADPHANPLTVVSVTQGRNGTVEIGQSGLSVLYTPAPGFAGVDSFTYTASGGSLTAIGSVRVSVSARVFLPLLAKGAEW